jgi:hypothetical protein
MEAQRTAQHLQFLNIVNVNQPNSRNQWKQALIASTFPAPSATHILDSFALDNAISQNLVEHEKTLQSP